MIKYMFKAHLEVIIALLIDAILLIIAVIYIHLLTNSSTSLPIVLEYFLFYIPRLQMPFFMALTVYLFTGRRFQNMLHHIGKQKTFYLQSIFLIATFISGWVSVIYVFAQGLITSSLSYYGFIFPWYWFIGILLSYHLLRFSSYKYQSTLIKAGVVILILWLATKVAALLSMSLALYFEFNMNNLTETSTNINPIALTTLSAYNQILLGSLLPSILIITLAIVGIIELKKVGS